MNALQLQQKMNIFHKKNFKIRVEEDQEKIIVDALQLQQKMNIKYHKQILKFV